MVQSKNSEQLEQYNISSPEAIANPYPIYHRLRSEAPVHWSDILGGAWLLTRYSDCVSAMRDPRLVEVYGKAIWMLGLDLPEHNRFRALVHKAFTPSVVEAMRLHIQTLVNELIDSVQVAGRMDVIRDIAYPLPAIVIAELLGVLPQDRDHFKKCSDDLAMFLGCAHPTPDTTARTQQSVLELADYLRNVVRQRRQYPHNDLITNLIGVEVEGDALSEGEVLGTCVFLIFAGHETTTNLIGNGLLALLRHPDQLEKLKDEPSLISTAVEELLRYDGPLQWASRIVEEDFELHGKQIRKRQRLLLIWGAANRDPVQFPNPDRLDINRQPNQHLAFGGGSHFCLGAALARIEGQIAINTILRRLPALQLETETLQWHDHSAFRGLKSLPVVF
jgi:pimeloyl-[acyl-carrier protein] synthase